MAGEDNVEFRLAQLEEDSRRNQATHKEFFARFENLGKDYTRIDAQYANILTTLAKLEAAVEELRLKPARRWDTLIAALVTGVVGFLLASVGLG